MWKTRMEKRKWKRHETMLCAWSKWKISNGIMNMEIEGKENRLRNANLALLSNGKSGPLAGDNSINDGLENQIVAKSGENLHKAPAEAQNSLCKYRAHAPSTHHHPQLPPPIQGCSNIWNGEGKFEFGRLKTAGLRRISLPVWWLN